MPPIVAEQICAYVGPNIYGPAPGVMLRARADRDRSARLRAALKDGALAIGMVIAGLQVAARRDGDSAHLLATFSSDLPDLGAALAAYVLEGMDAEAAGDATWDRDTPLAALRERQAREALPVAALQLLAEARQRGLPTLRFGEQLRIGYGARGWSLDLAALRAGAAPPTPPWERLGALPIVAVAGSSGRPVAVARLADEFAALGGRPTILDGAPIAAIQAALADPATEALVVGLDAGETLRHGLPFERCALATITDRDGPRPPEAADDDAWLRALGLPMLLSEQPARVNLADARLLPLLAYAPNGVIGL